MESEKLKDKLQERIKEFWVNVYQHFFYPYETQNIGSLLANKPKIREEDWFFAMNSDDSRWLEKQNKKVFLLLTPHF